MNVLVLNAGSSSIKFQVIEMPAAAVRCSGLVERIGQPDARITYRTPDAEKKETRSLATHQDGMNQVIAYLTHEEIGVVRSVADIDAVGHRVVHGGSTYSKTTRITAEVKETIKQLIPLAPLHNPHNLEGIELAERIFPHARQIAVFDTAFHQTLPEKAKRYAIPAHFFKEGIQVYGFHGTSHKYVSERAMEYMKSKTSKLISIHLGNGCSMTAIQDGKSIDHSLGFAPSNGLVMGSRSGDIDHALIFYLVETLGYTMAEVEGMLTKESGMLGMTGFSDLREVQRGAEKGNRDCQLALELSAYRIQKYIGAYAAAMNGMDAIIFTAGIGENSSVLRSLVCKNMDYLGLVLDPAINEQRSDRIRQIEDTARSKVKILVIPTNEELEIARQVFALEG
ncbi:acetate/propionate family kinase [Croceiramulus getboli]|nr:acetate kinase [Flavobacteriaceae bacterium YJPT1-3]